jgi:hypothetical protein
MNWPVAVIAGVTFFAFGFVVAVILYCTRPR